MAITTEEQVHEYRNKVATRDLIERDIENLERDCRSSTESKGKRLELYFQTISAEDIPDAIKMIQDLLEEKYENVSAELEEMLR